MGQQHEQLSTGINPFGNYVLKHSDGIMYCTISSKFTKEAQGIKAKQLADSFNNTVGKGIEPSAVPMMLKALESVNGLIASSWEKIRVDENNWEDTILDIREALEAAKIK